MSNQHLSTAMKSAHHPLSGSEPGWRHLCIEVGAKFDKAANDLAPFCFTAFGAYALFLEVQIGRSVMSRVPIYNMLDLDLVPPLSCRSIMANLKTDLAFHS